MSSWVWNLKLWIANLTVFLLKAGEEVLVGGQAVFEGVMMRSPKSYSIAVRKPDGTIVVKKDYLPRPADRRALWGYPLLRGIATLGQAFTLGVRALRFSTDQVLSSRDGNDNSAKGSEEAPGKVSTGMMAMNVVVALSVFVLLFKLLPLVLATWLQNHFTLIQDPLLFSLVDGVIRLGIFVLYIVLVSQIRDIRRIFEYHGAEHKVVFTYEAQESLTVDNARKHSTFHPRCGTSFLMVVMLISAVVYAFIPFESLAMKLLSRIILIPVIAGISYEIIRFAALQKTTVLQWITLPGLWLQRVTTKQPDDAQLEIAIRALDEALVLENAVVPQPVAA
ncbi:MAG: DUF1385 domain-containing protein [Acidobacteria bacterium]|nr:DUF1385 domain-containing protein [Acidobacteriota bacterium]